MKFNDQNHGGWTEGLEKFSQNMKINHNRDISGHNLYLLQTVDRDGNITGEAYGVNVLTDTGLKQACNSDIYLSYTACNVFIGKGSGTPSLSDTTLFDKITATGTTYNGYSTSYRRACKFDKTTGVWTAYRCYHQGYFDYTVSGVSEDVDVTELGYSYNGAINALWTHTLVYDSDGNISSIKKRVNERLYITIQFCANMNVNIIKKLWDQKQYLLAQPGAVLYNNNLYQFLVYGDPKYRPNIEDRSSWTSNSIYYRKEQPQVNYTMGEGYIDLYNNFSYSNHIATGKSTYGGGMYFGNRYSMCTKLIGVTTRNSYRFTQSYGLNSNMLSLTTTEELEEPEELVSTNIWTNAGSTSNRISNIFGNYWVDSTYGQGYLPVANFVIQSLRMYNHQTKEWDIEENFTQLSPNTLENSFVDHRLPIYVSLDGKSATYYVTQNITPEVAVTGFSNTGISVYATDEYWDTDTWEIIGNLTNIDESLQHKRYYISSGSDVLWPYRSWESLPSIIPPKMSFTFKARTRNNYTNILSNDEKGCVMLSDQIVYPELTENKGHRIDEGKCSIFLFSINNGSPLNGDKNSVSDWRGFGKLYSFDIYEGDELVRHFVPCYKLNENSSKTYGVYETKLQKFHPFVGNLQYTTSTNSTSYRNQGAEVDLADSEIPTDQQADYKQIEFLLHTGYNSDKSNHSASNSYYGYIDTEYVHKTTTRIVWDGVVYRNYTYSYNVLFGSRWLNQYPLIFWTNFDSTSSTVQNPRFSLNHYTNTLSKDMTLGTRIKIEAGCLDHEQILHGCNIYNQSTGELIDTTGELNYDSYTYASYITNNSYGYSRRWAMPDKFITIGNSYGNVIEFYNLPDNPSDDIICQLVRISEFTDTQGAEYKYYTFSGEDTGYLTIQRLSYNDCAIVNCNGDTPTYKYLSNTQKCTAILQTKYCVYRTTTNATTLEFEIYDMENDEVVDTFALPSEGYSLLWIVGWKNHIYIEVSLNGVVDIYYYEMITKQLRHVVGTSIPALTTNYGSFNKYYQYINVIANDEILIIANCVNDSSHYSQLHKIYDSDPLKYTTAARDLYYFAGTNGLQLKYLDNKKHLLLLFSSGYNYSTSSSGYMRAYVEDVGMYMDGVNTGYTYPTYHFPGRSDSANILVGFFKNGVIINNNSGSTYTWTPIEYWLPHEITGTTTTIQSYNNPRKLYNKSYEFKLTNDTTKFDDE